MALPQTTHRLTEAEYLALERAAAGVKSDFYDGEMFAMPTANVWHSRITTILTAEFGNKLRDSRYQPFNSDLRVKIEASGLYTYPDLSVVCGEDKHVDAEMDTLTNPTLLVEVLFPSTENYDRRRKFEHYRLIPSLKEYLLVSQDAPHIEQFVRRANQWVLRAAVGLKKKLLLPSLKISLSLAAVFRGVKFPPAELRHDSPRRP